MADQALNFLLTTFADLAKEEAQLLGGLREDIQLLSDEYVLLKNYLRLIESNKDNDPRLATWTTQLREAAYEAEDVIDEFKLLFARERELGFFGFVHIIFNCIANLPTRHRLANNLKSITKRISHISEARRRYESQHGEIPAQVSNHIPPANNDWRKSKDDEAIYANEDQLVGLNKPKQHLISQLLHGDSQLIKVIAVLGMGGMGKTTLVKRVHDDDDVKDHFKIRALVTISQTYDLKELLKNLILQLHDGFEPAPTRMESMDIPVLKAHMNEFLKRERYAIVFDDVWHNDNNNFWDDVKFVLPKNRYGGNCVMITTRFANLASSSGIGFDGRVFQMEFLTPEESMTLFCRKTFKDNCCPDNLKNVVEGIVQKCGGLPLAIVAISGVLATKDLSRVDEWERVKHRLGDESEGTGMLDRAKKILSLSYDDLPPTLKTCLLYTSIFPEGYEIPCRRLIQLWIAERFVEQRSGLSTEEVARGYLKELINRNLFQVSEELYDILPNCIQIHDILREVIVSKSREINLTTVISVTQHTEIRWIPEKLVRRLILHGDLLLNNFVTTQERHQSFNRLRSIITIGCTEPPTKAMFSELLSSKFLKIVCFEDMQLEEIPNEIFYLFLLTHLDLRGTRVKMVPKFIKRLQNLEYLNLMDTNVRELPAEILRLQKLRCLLLYRSVDSSNEAWGFKAPHNMGALVGLERLSCIDAVESDKTRIVNEIGKLTQLRILEIINLRREDGRELCSSLEKLTHLMDLTVASSAEGNEGIILDLNHPISASCLQSVYLLGLRGRLEKMPPWITNLQNLELLDLISSNLRDDPLELLQHLPNLIELFLIEAYQGESLSFKSGCFLKLRKLLLRKMKELRWMKVEEGAMPHIKQLFLVELPLLEEVPSGIEQLTELQKLQLENVSSELTKKLENGEKECEDYKRTAHIPEVNIWSIRDGKWVHRQQPQKK